MEETVCWKCRNDLHKGKEKYVQVSFGSVTHLFHPQCHICHVCDKAMGKGKNYTVEEKTGLAVCEPCWQKQHGSSNSLPTATGGVSWKPKPPQEKGFVWQQVALLDTSSPAAAEQAKKEAREKPMGTCETCKKKVFDQMVVLDDKTRLHPECHTCALCKASLVGSSFFSQGKQRLCEECITKKLSQLSVAPGPAAAVAAAPQQRSLGTCGACAKDITGKVVSAGGRSYCVGCLKCLKCARAIGGQDAYFTRENGVICENCG